MTDLEQIQITLKMQTLNCVIFLNLYLHHDQSDIVLTTQFHVKVKLISSKIEDHHTFNKILQRVSQKSLLTEHVQESIQIHIICFLLPEKLYFSDTQVSLAPTHVSPSVGWLVRWSIGLLVGPLVGSLVGPSVILSNC